MTTLATLFLQAQACSCLTSAVLGITEPRLLELLSGATPTINEAKVLAAFLQRTPADIFPGKMMA